jgi:hypothetical protein
MEGRYNEYKIRRNSAIWLQEEPMIIALLAGALAVGAPFQEGGPGTAPRPSIQESLVRPFRLPFREPTALDRVAAYLGSELSGPVVLDRAALTRLELRPDDTVQLELDGVRLKTGLQLLLDQVSMTFRIVPEDNLLILTDAYGADDPYERILDEIETLHRELHDLRDSVNDLQESLAAGEGAGGTMRKPTIIEELPGVSPGSERERTPQDAAEATEPKPVRPGAREPERSTSPGPMRRET